MYSKKGVVYKLHAGWFINRTPGEFINWGLFIKLKGLLCGNPTERAESLILSARRAVYKSNPGTVTVCRKRGASEQEKIQYIKYVHCQKIASRYHFYFLRSKGEFETPIVVCILFLALLGSVDLLDPSSFALRVCFCTLLRICFREFFFSSFCPCNLSFSSLLACHFTRHALLLTSLPALPLEICLLQCSA